MPNVAEEDSDGEAPRLTVPREGEGGWSSMGGSRGISSEGRVSTREGGRGVVSWL